MEPVAVIGMAVLLPGAPDLDTYWRNLRNGVDAISQAPPDRWEPDLYRPEARTTDPEAIYCRRGGFVDEFAEIDVASFGIMPNSVDGTEPDQLIALRVAAAAIADSGGESCLPDRDRIGVVLGRGGYLTPGVARLNQRVRTVHQLVRTLGELVPDLGAAELDRVRSAFSAQLGPSRPESAIGLVPNLAASRIANRLDLRGPAYTVDAACASSLIAVDQAIAELAAGRCDLMLAGGVHHCHDVTLWSVFAQLGALSPSERSRPFDRSADGILIGEGTGMIVLKRLADAVRDDDRVYAVIRGTGVSSDGRGASLMVPDPNGQVRAIRQAWSRAELDPTEPDALGLLEAHGTATPAGDAAELATLTEVFGPGERAVIGSVKSMIGHTMPTAGIASLIKAALAVHHRVLPPTLHCDDPHPRLADTRFRPISTAEAWPSDGPRRAGVNAFGFGGVNAHVLLEEAPHRAVAISIAEPEQILLMAANSPTDLTALLDTDDANVRHLTTMDGTSRLAIADPTTKRLALARRAVATGKPWRGRNDVWWYPAPLGGKVAFVFPGLEAEFAPNTRGLIGADLAEAPIGDIGRHGLGVVRLGMLLDANLRRQGIVPDGVAGHSVGEWTAMITSGMYQQQAIDEFLTAFDPDVLHVPEVAFAAAGASAAQVSEVLADHPDVVLSHDNAPSQSMVCGPLGSVEAVVRELRARRVMCQVLPFQSGFHTPMLAPYLDPIRRSAAAFDLRPPSLPMWSATTASPYPVETDAVRELFVRHLVEPVRFRALIEAMHADGYRMFVQAGVGQLTSLIGDTLHDADHLAVAASGQRDGQAQLRRVAAALWAAGVDHARAAAKPRASAQSHRLCVDTQPGGDRAAGGVPDDAPVGSHLDIAARAAEQNADRESDQEHDEEPGPDTGRESGRESDPESDRESDRESGPAFDREADPAVDRAAGRGDPLCIDTQHQGQCIDTQGRAVRLKLGSGAPIRLDTPTRNELRALVGTRSKSALDGLAARVPLAAELRSLLAETEEVVTTLLNARSTETVLRVSTESMPYLLDHCFFKQRPDWPDDEDRWPVVPATTVIDHMMGFAGDAMPGAVAVEVRDVVLNRWITAIPPIDIPVTAQPVGRDQVQVRLGHYAGAIVTLAHEHPRAGKPWPIPADERVPELAASRLYSDRWMFHGPRFQGVSELTGIGQRHVRAVLTTPAAPGALLDNVGQVFGYWVMTTLPERTVVFPMHLGRIRFHGPHPEPGTRVDCSVRVTRITDTTVVADAQLSIDGTVWAEFTDWTDRRFDSNPDTVAVERTPERATLSKIQPGGWMLLREYWSDVASRELIMRNHLGRAERDYYEKVPLRGRRQWLLGRIAAKDAVRTWLWAHGSGPLFPAEVAIGNDAQGKPFVRGELPAIEVSLAHSADLAVAMARPAGCGIDIEEVVERAPGAVFIALGNAERALLGSLTPRTFWFTRFWAAKEAAAKADGTGLDGAPRRFVVTAAHEDHIDITVDGRTRRVDCTTVAHGGRTFVVAWTENNKES
jgi:acyl transferase domain-containing protein/phosphopantetheinyl transferase